jgi:hypothetical protein
VKTLICAYSECNKEFNPQTHNQKYCSDVCCRISTNLKIREKYYENKERLKGKKRYCSERGCKNLLSRYNEDNRCQTCESKMESNKRNSLLGMFKNVSG